MVPGLDGRPAPVVGKRTRHAKRNSVRARVDHGKASGAGSIAQPALSYRARLADAESDAAEMELNGPPEEYAECMKLVDAINAPRKSATVRYAPVTLSTAIAYRTVAAVKAGVYERAEATSERRRKQADIMAWASYCFAKKSKITLDEFRRMPK